LARYTAVVAAARTPEEFVREVAAALEDGGRGTPSTRRAAVADATWDRRAVELMAALENLGRA
jgi:hypothetical protein